MNINKQPVDESSAGFDIVQNVNGPELHVEAVLSMTQVLQASKVHTAPGLVGIDVKFVGTHAQYDKIDVETSVITSVKKDFSGVTHEH